MDRQVLCLSNWVAQRPCGFPCYRNKPGFRREVSWYCISRIFCYGVDEMDGLFWKFCFENTAGEQLGAVVVETSVWPKRACMVRISAPRWRRCVAKLCRKVWALIRLVRPALRTATLMALLITLGFYMMPPYNAAAWISREITSRENVLPTPFPRRILILSGQSMGHVYFTVSQYQVIFMHYFDLSRMVLQKRDYCWWKCGYSVLGSFPGADCNCFHIIINVLHAQTYGLWYP